MLILSEQNVRQCLDMKSCIEINQQALISIANGTSNIPTRLGLPYIAPPSSASSSSTDNTTSETATVATDWTLFKPASASIGGDDVGLINALEGNVGDESAKSIPAPESSTLSSNTETTSTTTTHMGIKIVSIRHENPIRYQLPLVPATILHINPITGIVDAVVAGTYLTAARTAAGSALSYQYTHHQQQFDSTRTSFPTIPNMTLFGAGLQAEMHLHAFYTLLHHQPISSSLTIINRSYPRANELKQKALRNGWIQHEDHCQIIVSNTTSDSISNNSDMIQKVIEQSDCIITTTNTIQPLWTTGYPKPNCHIISIGSYTSHMQEIPSYIVQKCRIYIDTKEAIEVGDIQNANLMISSSSTSWSPTTSLRDCHPIELLGKSLLDAQHVHQQRHQPYTPHNNDDERQQQLYPYTFYKSVGTAIQDILTVDLVVQRAKQLGLGIEVDMT
jgi:ornithine cyclodeaminase/alanine dehydrogenase-like protein (mu-crystallin family)